MTTVYSILESAEIFARSMVKNLEGCVANKVMPVEYTTLEGSIRDWSRLLNILKCREIFEQQNERKAH